MKRCDWVTDDIHIQYHDTEWGVPLYDDRKLYEFLILDGMQSGLTWKIILNKRKDIQKAFDNFDPIKISKYTQKDTNRLLLDANIIRNKRKIESAINNAKQFLKVKKEFGTFHSFIWSFVNYKTIQNRFKSWSEIPATTKESQIMSKDMKKRGFTFVGPTICYAFMQTVGMVNDHQIGCFRQN